MVYCTKCGTKNPDDAEVCSQCGASLQKVGESEQRKRVESECFGPRRASEPYRRVEQECFGLPRGGVIVGIVIGVLIVLAGLSLLLQRVYPGTPDFWWPAALMIVGALFVIGALYGMRRKR